MIKSQIERAGVAVAVLAIAVSPAFAHLDPAEHAGLAGEAPHPFGVEHVVASIGIALVIAAIGFIEWRRRRAASARALVDEGLSR
jgi:hydrogenase/urease accessory protein HupE